jgi:SAM-dependent methyltransferase
VRDLAKKTDLYRSIAKALRPGGVFVNADITIPTDPNESKATYGRWSDQMVRAGIEEPQTWKHFDEWSGEDRYFSLEEELAAIGAAGLHASYPWRHNPATVTVGRKP